jgi:hypothetical protein
LVTWWLTLRCRWRGYHLPRRTLTGGIRCTWCQGIGIDVVSP